MNLNNEFNLKLPLPSIVPSSWKKELGAIDFMCFRNLEHFKHIVSNIIQLDDTKCGMSYKEALVKLLKKQSDFPKKEQESIRDLVRSNLHKRGLITQEVYENFRYTYDGTQVDVDIGKFVNGEPDCVISPSVQYIDFFYELYINISYPYYIDNAQVRKSVAKLLATIEELERQHVFIKITLVFPARSVSLNNRNSYFSMLPLFSHKQIKSIDLMSSVVNDRLLRKFFFAILENTYFENLSSNYGFAKTLTGTMNIGEEFNEIDFFENIIDAVRK